MKNNIIFISCLIVLFTYIEGSAQTVKISKPQIALNDNIFRIQYDILNSNLTDKFNVSLDIEDSSGKQISAKAISGDIGNNISGGSGKEITWDLTIDSIYMEAMIYFKIRAKAIEIESTSAGLARTVPEPVSEINESSIEGNSPNTTENLNRTTNISRGSAVFQSLLFPGVGLTRISSGKPHWLKGVMGYGCLATAIIYNSTSNISYNDYLQASTFQEKNDLYVVVEQQKKISNAFLFSAIGVWAIDFIWTVSGSKDLRKISSNNVTNDFSLYASYNYEVQAPLLALKFNF